MAPRTRKSVVQCTKNYDLFQVDRENRDKDFRKHKRLLESMQKYGFLQAYPIVCRRDSNGTLHIKDGQHRFFFAKSLGLPVYWVEDDSEFQIDQINNTQIQWSLKDYAQKHARSGNRHYQSALEFCERHGLPLSMGFLILSGQTTFRNVKDAFTAGKFVSRDERFADRVAATYSGMVALCRALRHQRFLEACIAACRVPQFDPERLLHCAGRCREKLVSYATRDANLDMMEQVYNFNQRRLFPLKITAIEVMRSRNPCVQRHGSSNGRHKKRKSIATA